MYVSLWFTVAVLAVSDGAVASKISQHQGGIPARGYNFTSVTTCLETRSASNFSSTTTVSYTPSIYSSSVEEYSQQTAASSSSYDPYPPVSLSTQHAPSVAFHQSSTVLQSSRPSITTQLNIPVATSGTSTASSMWKSPETSERATATTTPNIIPNTPSIASIVPQFTSTLIPVRWPLSDVNSLTDKPTSTPNSFTPQSTTKSTSIQLDTTTFQTFTFSETSTVTITQAMSSVTSLPRLPESELTSSSITRSVLFPFFPSSTLEIAPTSTLSILQPTSTTQLAPILFGTQTLSQDSYSNLIFGSQTLLPGSAITVNGQSITLASGGAIIINPASTLTSQTSNPSSNSAPAPESLTLNPTTTRSSSPAVVIVDGSSITANPSTGFVIGTQTLYPGNKITETGEVLTLPSLASIPTTSPPLAPFGNGTTGFSNSTNSQSPSTLVTSTSQAQITSLQIAGQTLTQGGVVTILDEVLSLVSGSAVVVVKTVDTTAPPASTSTGAVHKSRGGRIESFGLLLVGIQGLLVVLVSGF